MSKALNLRVLLHREINMKNKGFTILEITSVLAIFLLILLLVGSIHVMAQRTSRRGADQSELTQNARVVLDRISRELRQADGIISIISSTTPVSEILFKDGHDDSQITYIRYYLDGNEIKRSHHAYYFNTDPATYVIWDSLDIFGNPPIELVLEDRVVGEYLETVELISVDGLVEINLILNKNRSRIHFGTKVYIRNF